LWLILLFCWILCSLIRKYLLLFCNLMFLKSYCFSKWIRVSWIIMELIFIMILFKWTILVCSLLICVMIFLRILMLLKIILIFIYFVSSIFILLPISVFNCLWLRIKLIHRMKNKWIFKSKLIKSRRIQILIDK
jgi:hypothetical protein